LGGAGVFEFLKMTATPMIPANRLPPSTISFVLSIFYEAVIATVNVMTVVPPTGVHVMVSVPTV